ncbi:DNA polymerase IV [Methanolobus profundi]|uniref:DNA polymerase IV n=1 Tax=Methanolobus profundi TaxID=487685 RepID=A0A1I4T5K2_9EURY|nr:DNA polymerase IV [Methanolobus profundi]SFM71956.1 DNA polymerase IV (DinB-like DNA polymerase) [Methanolobus profundi]
MERVIIHVDMDYFYAAIEEREDPSLKGKAVVVCMYSNRGESGGAVSTSNYIAREAGIRSAMPCKLARSKDPDAVFLPVRKPFYEDVSANVMEILRSNADSEEAFEKISIDEAFLDITESCKGDYETAKEIGLRIKEEVKEKERITCSVGIGPNKLIAKMASSFRKPDGITVIGPEDAEGFLKPMPVKKLWGIGKVTEDKLSEMGISTVEELAAFDVMELISTFGKNKGMWLKQAASGIDDSPVKERTATDQIGRMASLKHDSRNENMIFSLLEELMDDVMEKVRTRKVSFRSVTVTVIFSNFKTSTKSRTLNHAVNDRDILSQNAREMMSQFLEESEINFRRIGVRVDNLHENTGQKSLFDF